jgi:hypothetical protein
MPPTLTVFDYIASRQGVVAGGSFDSVDETIDSTTSILEILIGPC